MNWKTQLLQEWVRLKRVHLSGRSNSERHLHDLTASLAALPRRIAKFGTTDSDPRAITLPDAAAALSRLCLLDYHLDE